MERWVHWCQEGTRPQFANARTLIERARSGMPSTKCPKCRGHGHTKAHPVCPMCSGEGRIKLKPEPPRKWTLPCQSCLPKKEPGRERPRRGTGEINGRTCTRCHGAGVLIRHEHKVNPAFIPGTWTKAADPVAQRIDRLVCELDLRRRAQPRRYHKYFAAVWEQYRSRDGGTQAQHAERLGVSYRQYTEALHRALVWIEQSLPDSRPPKAIPFPWQPGKKSY